MEICNIVKSVIEAQDIRTLYQPIVLLSSGEVLGYEALSRGPKDTPLESPDLLLNLASQCEMTWEMEFLMRKLAIERARDLGEHQYLFINVDPHVIHDENFQKGMTKEFLSQYGIAQKNVVMEITERSAITDYEGFNKTLQNYVDQDFKIAIDDVGEGYSGINRIIETRPHFLKLDMNIIRKLEADTFKQAIVKSFVQLAELTHITLIAEGIETKEELRTLIHLGVSAGQGFYLQRPAEKMTSLPIPLTSEILEFNAFYKRP